MSYRQDILGAVLDIYTAETKKGTWATKDSDNLYKSRPPRWTSLGSRLELYNIEMAFEIPGGNVPTRLAPPMFVNRVKITLPLIGVEMLVNRTGEDFYENNFSKDIILPHVLAVRALCVNSVESQNQAA